ncbi:unnamed protein product [Mytilus coruscus]|uniref:Uncharacterized protein n=1 Tax=Mytilus coruscus TaxID=42192 RepID=A0A6J8CD98_MYTCO|nr:unnamed protein product [Mytilus coruscus]
MSNSSNFDGTAPLGWSLLKANIESTAFVKGWKSEQKLQTLVSRITGKALKFYKNRSYTEQADYETLCKLFNDRFDSVGYPLLILENLNNIFPYPDELLDEFTDRIEELVEEAFQNETENVKEHLIIKYLTNACWDEEGKELVKAVAEDSVYEAKRYLCTLSKITAKRYLKLKSLWEPKMKNRRDNINFKIEKTRDHDLIVRSQGTDEIVDSENTTRTVNNDEPEYYTPSKHLNEVEWNGTIERKRTGTNWKIEKMEDHCSVIIGQRTEQTAHEGETIEKESNPVIEYYTTPCHLKDVKEDAVYTMESPSPEYETDWLGEADDIRQTEESPSPNYKPDAICEADEKGQKIPTNSHCFNEQKRDYDKKINQSKVNADKPKETSRSGKTQTKHEKGENKDVKQLINRNSYQKQLSQSERELLSNIIDRLTPNSVYCQDNLLTLELKDKQYRYWMTSHGNTETHNHDKGEDRERDSNKEGNSLQDTQSNCVKRHILKNEAMDTN